MTRVLVLDGGQRKSLAAVRTLADRGDEAYVADDSTISLAGWSNAAKATLRLAPPSDPRFLRELEKAANDEQIEVVLPTDDQSTQTLAGRTCIGPAAIFVPSREAFAIARDKWRTIALARQVDVRVPESAKPDSDAEAQSVLTSFPLPALVKPRESSGGRGITFAENREELRAAYRRVSERYERPMIQRWIRPVSRKVHVCTLVRAGVPLAIFTHEILREWPVAGGVGTLWRSVKDDGAIETTLRLMQATKWTGVAMTEYVYLPESNDPILMEINPRFWNTLALSIACGVDFPALWVDAALGKNVRGPDEWPVGRVAQWLVPGDLLNFLFNPARFRQTLGYLPGAGRVHAIWRSDDPLPLLAMLLIMLRGAFSPRMWRYALRF